MHRRARKKSPVFGLLLPLGVPFLGEETEPLSVSFSSTAWGRGGGGGVLGKHLFLRAVSEEVSPVLPSPTYTFPPLCL